MKLKVEVTLTGRDATSFIAGDNWTPITAYNFLRSLKLARDGGLRDEDGNLLGRVEVEP